MKISVVVTCFNEERYIEECIKSITKQSIYHSIDEIFVVDDGSTDNSFKILERLNTEIEKLNVIKTKGVGVSKARNIGIKSTKNEFIALLDADDFWHKDKLKNQIGAFNYDKSIGLVYGDYWDFSKEDASDSKLVKVKAFNLKFKNHLKEYFLYDAPIIPSATIYRRKALFSSGLYNENLKFYEDCELNLRISENWNFFYVSGGLIYKRKKENQITARLDKLINNVFIISDISAKRNPFLKKYIKNRNSRYLYKSALDCYFRHKEKKKTLEHSINAIKTNPLNFKACLLIIMIMIPYNANLTIYNFLKKLFYKFRSK